MPTKRFICEDERRITMKAEKQLTQTKVKKKRKKITDCQSKTGNRRKKRTKVPKNREIDVRIW